MHPITILFTLFSTLSFAYSELDSPCSPKEVHLCCSNLLVGKRAYNFLNNNGLPLQQLCPGSGVALGCINRPQSFCPPSDISATHHDYSAPEHSRTSGIRSGTQNGKTLMDDATISVCCNPDEDHRYAEGYITVGCAAGEPVEEAQGEVLS